MILLDLMKLLFSWEKKESETHIEFPVPGSHFQHLKKEDQIKKEKAAKLAAKAEEKAVKGAKTNKKKK